MLAPLIPLMHVRRVNQCTSLQHSRWRGTQALGVQQSTPHCLPTKRARCHTGSAPCIVLATPDVQLFNCCGDLHCVLHIRNPALTCQSAMAHKCMHHTLGVLSFNVDTGALNQLQCLRTLPHGVQVRYSMPCGDGRAAPAHRARVRAHRSLGVLAFVGTGRHCSTVCGLTMLIMMHGVNTMVWYQPLRAGHRGSADVHIRPDNKFLYVSNRTNHSITIFGISAEDGQLELVGHSPTAGDTPRNFAITADGTVYFTSDVTYLEVNAVPPPPPPCTAVPPLATKPERRSAVQSYLREHGHELI